MWCYERMHEHGRNRHGNGKRVITHLHDMGSRSSNFTLTAPGPLRVYSTQELLTLPPPAWLIDQILPEGGVCGLYGPPESAKSFLAIDLALCVATGFAWHGQAAQPGFVLYIAAEGGPGISKRVRAWLIGHGQIQPAQPMIAWLIESMVLTKDSDDVETLMQRLDDEMECRPRLIVVDTLARCFEGSENETEDMNKFVAALDHFRHAYGSTLLFLHHTRLDETRERGNTALRGGVDTMLSVEDIERNDRGSVTGFSVLCTKQKDAEHFSPMTFRVELVPEADSCVVRRTDQDREDEKAQRMKHILGILQSQGPLSWDEFRMASKLPRSSFHRYMLELKRKGIIIKENGLWQFHVSNISHVGTGINRE